MSTSAGPFDYIRNADHMASALGVGLSELEFVKGLIANGRAYHYRNKSVHGKLRVLAVPFERVGSLQHRINDFLWPLSFDLHPACHGYVPDHSTMTNAAPHCGAPWIQRLDIKDFYPSTHRKTITGTLMAWGASQEIAELISDLITDKDRLPLGAHCSPLVSNLILTPVDSVIADAAAGRVTYTRYADDLTFSAEVKFDMTEVASAALRPLGYELNTEKSRLRRRGQSISVTGLRVAESDHPRLPKQYKRRLRQEFYFIERFGLEEHCFRRYSWDWIEEDDDWRQLAYSRRHLQGKIKYALGIEPEWMNALLAAYPAVAAELRPSHGKQVEQRHTALVALATEIRKRPHVPLTRQPTHLGAVGARIPRRLTE